MSIIFNENTKTFTLHTNHTTYQMKIDVYGYLIHLYYGRKTEGNMDFLLTYIDRGFSGNPYEADKNRIYSLDVLPQEFPYLGTGDYRNPSLILRDNDGVYGCDLRYESYQISKGKYGLNGLPAVYASDEEADTLDICLSDQQLGVKVHLLYGVLPACDIITRAVKIENNSSKTLYIEKVASANLDLISGKYDAISFYGRHAMERQYQRMPVGHGSFSIGSTRGTSSHHYSPCVILADQKATETAGSCYGMSFVYSGGFKCNIEMDQIDQTRMTIGTQDEQFDYQVCPGEAFDAPEVIMTYSCDGLEKLSHQLHTCIRKHICRGEYKEAPRPILVNSWESSYFDINHENLIDLAKNAKELGMDMLVMDDGWFGKRDNDLSGLGDWFVNEDKLGMSIGELSKQVHDLGLKFGIWFEPEAVNEDSDLFREHPDWALQVPGRAYSRSRYQMILDFSRKEVVDEIYHRVCNVLDQGQFEYFKWDMNRSLSDIYSADTPHQGNVLHDYVLGLYSFLERITARYPHILFEGCSGGGGRFDAGMLYYTPQIWCSDNTDAADRLRIQYGTSFGFPSSTVAAHVSAVPNHQTGRKISMKTRGVVAMAGMFGYELNLGKLSEEEKEEVKIQIETYRKYESLVRTGLYYRLANPFEDGYSAWAFVSEDGKEALISAVRVENHGNMPAYHLALRGLLSGTTYKDCETDIEYPSDALMEVGLPLIPKMEDYQSWQWHLIAE